MFHDNMYIQKKEKKNHQRRLKKITSLSSMSVSIFPTQK